MSFNLASFLARVSPQIKSGLKLTGGVVGGAALSEGANAGYRMGTREDLPAPTRVALGGIGVASLMGKLSPAAQPVSH